MTSNDACWDKYAGHIKNWYTTTYKGNQGVTKAINDGRLARKTIRQKKEHTTYDNLKASGVSDFAAKSIILYIENTKESYIKRCISETGGFAPDVACMSDNDCPRGYRCRGVGKDSECIPEGEPIKVNKVVVPSLPKLSMPSIDVKMPSFDVGGKAKLVGGFIILLVVGVVLLVAIGYSGMGGSVGRVAESEHKRKRG